jgi:hypothetical protein
MQLIDAVCGLTTRSCRERCGQLLIAMIRLLCALEKVITCLLKIKLQPANTMVFYALKCFLAHLICSKLHLQKRSVQLRFTQILNKVYTLQEI